MHRLCRLPTTSLKDEVVGELEGYECQYSANIYEEIGRRFSRVIVFVGMSGPDGQPQGNRKISNLHYKCAYNSECDNGITAKE